MFILLLFTIVTNALSIFDILFLVDFAIYNSNQKP